MLKNAICLFCFALLVLAVFLPSYSKMQDLQKKNQDYALRIGQLDEENKRLKEEKRRLEDDPVYLEKVAREKMGLIRKGEVVYQVEPVNKEN